MTPPPPPPSWFGPRASTGDPAVAALLDQVAPGRTWQDIGGSFNLNVRLDAAVPLVLRVHQESHLQLFEQLGRLHAGLRATWGPDLPPPLDDHRTHRRLHYWLGFTRRRLGPGAEPVVRRAKLLLDELGKARRGIDLPRAPVHGDYKLGNAVQLPDGSWANLDLDFVRICERLYDVAGSLYWASDSGAHVNLRELCDAYDSSAPEPMTPGERQFLPGQITLIPLHWVAAAGFMDEPIGVQGAVGLSEAEKAMDTAEAWWARREELTW